MSEAIEVTLEEREPSIVPPVQQEDDVDMQADMPADMQVQSDQEEVSEPSFDPFAQPEDVTEDQPPKVEAEEQPETEIVEEQPAQPETPESHKEDPQSEPEPYMEPFAIEEKTTDTLIQDLLDSTSPEQAALAAATLAASSSTTSQPPEEEEETKSTTKRRKVSPTEDLIASLQESKKLAEPNEPLTAVMKDNDVDFVGLQLPQAAFTIVEVFPQIKISKGKREQSLEEKLQALYKHAKLIEQMYYDLYSKGYTSQRSLRALLTKLFESMVLADHLQQEIENISERNPQALVLVKQLNAFLSDILRHLKLERNLQAFVDEWLRSSFENFNADQQKLIEETLKLSLEPLEPTPELHIEDDVRITNPQSILVFLATLANIPSYLIYNDFHSMSSQGRQFLVDPVFLKFFETLSTQQQLQFIRDYDAIKRYKTMTDPIVSNTLPPEPSDGSISISKYLAPVPNDTEKFIEQFVDKIMSKEYFLETACKDDNLFYDFVLNGEFTSLTSADRQQLLNSSDSEKQRIAQYNTDDAFLRISKFVNTMYGIEVDQEMMSCIEKAADKVSALTYELFRASNFDRFKLELNITKKLHTFLDKLIRTVLEQDYRNKLDDKVLSLAIKYANNSAPAQTKIVFEKERLNPRLITTASRQSLLTTLRQSWLNNENDLQSQVALFDTYLYGKYKTSLGNMSEDELSRVLAKYHSDNLDSGQCLTPTRDFLRMWLRLYGNFNALPKKTERTFTKMTDIEDLPSFISTSSGELDIIEKLKEATQGMELLQQYYAAALQNSTTTASELLKRIQDEVNKMHLTTYIDVPFVMDQAMSNNFRYLDEALHLAGVRDVDAQKYRLAIRANDQALVEKLRRFLTAFSHSENDRILRKLQSSFLPLYRATAVYNRQPARMNKSLYLINPLVTDKSFQKRRLRRQHLLKPSELISRNLQKRKTLEIDTNLYQTKPWMKYDDKYTWYIRPVLNGQSLDKEGLSREDPVRRFLGSAYPSYPQMYVPTQSFWTWYSNESGSDSVREFDAKCKPVDRFKTFFFGPKRRVDLGLVNVEKGEVIPFTPKDMEDECNYIQRLMQPMDVLLTSLMHSFNEPSADLFNLNDALVKQVESSLEHVKQTYKVYSLIDAPAVAKQIVRSYIRNGLNSQQTIGMLMRRVLTLALVLRSPMAMHLLATVPERKLENIDTSLDLQGMVPMLLVAPNTIRRSIEDIVDAYVMNQAWDILFDIHIASQKAQVFAKSIIDATRLNNKKIDDVFISSYKDQYKNLCANEVQGSIVFYYTSTVDQKLYCAGFEEINQILTSPSLDPNMIGIAGLSPEAIQLIRSKFSAGNDFGSQLKEINEQVRGAVNAGLTSSTVRAAKKWNELKGDMFVADIDLSDDKKYPELQPLFDLIVRQLRITDPVMANLAADHLATLVHDEVLSGAIEVLQRLLQNPQSWPSFRQFIDLYKQEAETRSVVYARKCNEVETSNTDVYNRCLQEQILVSRNDRKQRQELFSKNINGGQSILSYLSTQVPYLDNYGGFDELIDYLSVALDLPNVSAEERMQTCERPGCTNVQAEINSVTIGSQGSRERHCCSDLQCFTYLFAEDKLTPISSVDIRSSEITNNIHELFAPFYTDQDLKDLAQRFQVAVVDEDLTYPRSIELWSTLVLTFNPMIFSDAFIESRSDNINQLFQRFIDESRSSTYRSLPLYQRFQMLLKDQRFMEAVEKVLKIRQIESEDVMQQVELLLSPWEITENIVPGQPSSFEQTVRKFVDESNYENKELYADANATQLLHFLIFNNFKGWDTSRGRLPAPVIEALKVTINDLYNEFLLKRAVSESAYREYKNVTDPNRQLEKLFTESDKFQEALEKKLKLIFTEESEDEEETQKAPKEMRLNNPFVPGCTQVTTSSAQEWMQKYVRERLLQNQPLLGLLQQDRKPQFDETFGLERDDEGALKTSFDFLNLVSEFSNDHSMESCLVYNEQQQMKVQSYKETEAVLAVLGLVSFGVYRDNGVDKTWPTLIRHWFGSSTNGSDDVLRIVLYYCYDAVLAYMNSSSQNRDAELADEVYNIGQMIVSYPKWMWNVDAKFKVDWKKPDLWSRSPAEEKVSSILENAIKSNSLYDLVQLAKKIDEPIEPIEAFIRSYQKAVRAVTESDPMAKSLMKQALEDKAKIEKELSLKLGFELNEKRNQRLQRVDNMHQRVIQYIRSADIQSSHLMFFRDDESAHRKLFKSNQNRVEAAKKSGDVKAFAALTFVHLRDYYSLPLGLLMYSIAVDDIPVTLKRIESTINDLSVQLSKLSDDMERASIEQRIRVLKNRHRSLKYLGWKKDAMKQKQVDFGRSGKVYIPSLANIVTILPPPVAAQNVMLERLFKLFFNELQRMLPPALPSSAVESYKDLRTFIRLVQDNLSDRTGAVAAGCVDKNNRLKYAFDLVIPLKEEEALYEPEEESEEEEEDDEFASVYASMGVEGVKTAKRPRLTSSLFSVIDYKDQPLSNKKKCAAVFDSDVEEDEFLDGASSDESEDEGAGAMEMDIEDIVEQDEFAEIKEERRQARQRHKESLEADKKAKADLDRELKRQKRK